MNKADLRGPELAALIFASVFYGIAAVLLFRKFTDRASIRQTMNRILAHLMELGLFLDSPALILCAQWELLRENGRLLRLTMAPTALLGLAFALGYSPMDAFFGHAPLPPGEPSVVTIRMRSPNMPAVKLEAPAGMVVETPAVRVLRDHEISWRVRPVQPATGQPQFRLENRVVTANAILFRDPAIRSIEVRYPKTAILGFPWLAWFGMISSISAAVFQLCWKR